MGKKVAHFMYMPLTGLGLYGGHRGERWLRNRITIFKQFVLPSLLAQENQDFILWVSVRYEDRSSKTIQAFKEFLEATALKKVVFTYEGVCFWDDKYPDDQAYSRLVHSVHNSMPDLINAMGEAEEVYMTIQPSDDCYSSWAIDEIHDEFEKDPSLQVFGYKKGFVMDYKALRLKEWNPSTTPPFYTIRFPRDTFVDPLKHLQYTGPYKSHEYVKDFLKAKYINGRGFLVGTHGENISTVFNHPFAGREFVYFAKDVVLRHFGLKGVEPLKLPLSLRKKIMRRLPHAWQRKLRYWLGERTYAKFYAFIRS